MVKNSAISGCCSSKPLTNSMVPPATVIKSIGSARSIHSQAAATELSAHTVRQFGIRRLDAFQRVGNAELVPLVAPHLVKAQDLHALDRLETGAEVCNFF